MAFPNWRASAISLLLGKLIQAMPFTPVLSHPDTYPRSFTMGSSANLLCMLALR